MFKNIHFTVSALAICCSTAAIAQTGSIKGTVNTSGSMPVENATVIIKDGKATRTDNAGNYQFTDLTPGKYKVAIAVTNYDTVWENATVENGGTTVLSTTLKHAHRQMQEFVLTGNKNRYKVDKTAPSLRLDEPLKEVPQNIQVVTSAALADQQVISMSDGAIRNVSGATTLEHWGDLYTRINMRGSQIAAFRNGVNVVNSAWGPLTEDMSFVDHIEFVKGPAGFMMANGDPSGMYNVVTKKPTFNGFNGEASFTMGSFDLYRATLDLDGTMGKSGKLGYRLNLMQQTKNSFRPYEFNDRYSIAPVLTYKLDDKTTLTFEYTLQHVKMSNVGSYYMFAPDGYATTPRDFTLMAPGLTPTLIDDHSAFVNMQHKINDNWKITAQAAYLSYNQKGSSMWPTAVNPDGTIIRNVSIWDAMSQIKSGQAYLNGNAQTGKIHHRILVGLDMGTKNYYADWSQSHDLDTAGAAFDPKNPVYGTPVNGYPEFDRTLSIQARAIAGYGTIDQRFSGLYAQDELGFFDNKLRVTLAGRYTSVTQSSYGGAPLSANRFTPRIGVSYSVNDATSVYGLYDQAFVPQTGVMRSGGDIKPITGNNMEVGVKRDWMNGKWNSTLSIYRILKNNELTNDPLNTGNEAFSVVLGQKMSQGVELDVKGEIVNGLSVVFNYAYTDSKVESITDGVTSIKAGDRIPGYATHNINLWLNYKVQSGTLKGFGASAGFNYQADRDTWTWGTAGMKTLPNYFRLDGGLFWEKGKLRLTANVFNILNAYLYTGSYYGYGSYYYWQAEAPRNSRFSISYKF